MCVQSKSILTNRCEKLSEESNSSSVRGKTIRSRYRVLDLLSRGNKLSVNRNCAGRNAKSKDSSVKGSSSDKLLISVVAEQVFRSEGSTEGNHAQSTTGVQAHGMYRRPILELERSLGDRLRRNKFSGQELKFKPKIISSREVRCLRSSWEVV